MGQVQMYRCTSKDCRRTKAVAQKPGVEFVQAPRCFCGTKMKKTYTSPKIRELSPSEAEQLFASLKQ